MKLKIMFFVVSMKVIKNRVNTPYTTQPPLGSSSTHENITAEKFIKSDTSNIISRIQSNVDNFLNSYE